MQTKPPEDFAVPTDASTSSRSQKARFNATTISADDDGPWKSQIQVRGTTCTSAAAAPIDVAVAPCGRRRILPKEHSNTTTSARSETEKVVSTGLLWDD